MSSPQFRWPNNSEHALLLGQNGSGKSVFAAHMLSNAPIDKQPFVVIDYKDEELLNGIHHAHYIDFKDKPKYPGIYILKAEPSKDDERMDKFLYGVLARGKTGLLYDEGYMVSDLPSVEAIYTQGRSKRIPCITLSQRPTWLNRFAISEAKFYGLFRLNDIRDQQKILNFVPHGDPVWNMRNSIAQYHLRWYDSGQHASWVLAPAPDPEMILQRFDERLKPKRTVL